MCSSNSFGKSNHLRDGIARAREQVVRMDIAGFSRLG